MKNNIAPEGKTWWCRACGKANNDLYGGTSVLWDASCAINAILVNKDDLVSRGDGTYMVADGEEK